jgi:CheY-like chemotaxis protein
MKEEPAIILLAEDDPDDILLTQEAIEESNIAGSLEVVHDGAELLDYLRGTGVHKKRKNQPLPTLILLDLNMPKIDGREVLQQIKADPKLRIIPIVVLTTSRLPEDVVTSYKLGVNSFITKPVKFEDFVDIMKTIGKYWFETVELPVVRKK